MRYLVYLGTCFVIVVTKVKQCTRSNQTEGMTSMKGAVVSRRLLIVFVVASEELVDV